MGYKQYAHKSFYVELNGKTIGFQCFAENTRYGFRHVCDFDPNGDAWTWVRAKRCYYNRTWERFQFESVLHAAADKCPRELAAAVRAMCDKIAEREHDAAEKFIADFKRDYEKCPAGVKKALSSVTVESEADANFIAGTVKAIALLTEK